jgi:hypothetical protein
MGSHLQESRNQRKIGIIDPKRWDCQVVPKRRYGIATIQCIIYRKSADLIYIAAEV